MGKKAKLGKRRKDKFYQLAKETGYRARSAFKLIQLNRKFQFLQQSRVLVDLCAAPGGWLQVASQYMPVSSVIIGVDLVSIKPIPNVITIQADITTPNCRQLIQKELQTWKVDCVLNDGAPNVGTAWIQDAFTQAQLTLSALKLATEVLRPGGWFVTKVFRSKDYQSLLNVLQQMFKKVHATKPQASRSESAEIFVVCKGYTIKGKPDQKLLDPKFVFEEQEPLEKPKISLQRLQKPPKGAEGYREGQHILFESLPVIDFVMSDDHMSLLATVHELVFDKQSEVLKRHPLTIEEILQSCQDIKVLGLRELKKLVTWRKKMKEFLDQVSDSENEKDGKAGGKKEESDDEMDLTEVDSKIKELAQEEKAELKRILRHKKKQKKKIQERITAQLEAQTETAELTSSTRDKLFTLKSIKTKKQLHEVDKGDSEIDDSDPDDTTPLLIEEDYNQRYDNNEDENEENQNLVGTTTIPSSDNYEIEEDTDEEDTDDDEDDENENDIDLEEIEKNEPRSGSNPLLVSNEEKRSQKTNRWFSNPLFSGITDEEEKDEEEEIAAAMKRFKLRGGKILSKKEDDNQLEQEGDEEHTVVSSERQPVVVTNGTSFDSGDSSDDDENPPPKIRKLDPAGLAIGALMVQSRKKRQEIIESGYNRWTADDSNLPDWFREEENSHCQKQLPITKQMVDEYRKKLKEINARPIKKIAEAKARKKARSNRKLTKAREKAQVICETNDVTDQEKVHRIKSLYKKAGLVGQKKQEVKYIVAKKGLGKKVRRPAGVNGRFKVVDPRMKKDNRKQKMNGKNKHSKKGRRR